MTARARISQGDMERAAKAVKAGGFQNARIVFDLANGRIEIIIGDGAADERRINPFDVELE